MKKQAMHQPHQHRRTVWGRRCPSPAGHPKEGPSLDPSGGSLVCGEVAGWGGWNVTWHYECTSGASGGTGSALGIRNLQQQWEEAEVQSRQEGSQEILV